MAVASVARSAATLWEDKFYELGMELSKEGSLKAIGTIEVGHRVVIKKGTRYYGVNSINPADVPGTVVVRNGDGRIIVQWDSGPTNSYDSSDLELLSLITYSLSTASTTDGGVHVKRGQAVRLVGGKNDGKVRRVRKVTPAGITVSVSGRDVILKAGQYTTDTLPTIEHKPGTDMSQKKRHLTSMAEKMSDPLGANDILGQDHVLDMLQLAADSDIPALLIGETGTGKTTLVKHLAEKNGKKWSRFNLTGETTVDDFVGKFILKDEETVWQDGILLQAMKDGSWLVVDEVNVALPEILFVLHSLLDDDKYVVVASNDGKVVKPHEDFRLFATMNPVDEYAGTKDLNKSFKSRFGVILHVEYPEPIIETKIVSGKTGIDSPTAAVMVDVANKIRALKDKEEIFYTCSTRDIIQWAKLSRLTDIQSAFESAILNKAEGDKPKILDLYKNTSLDYKSKQASGYSTNLDYLIQQEQEFRDAKKQWEEDKQDVTAVVRAELISKIQA